MPTKRMNAGEEQWAFAGVLPVNAPGVVVVSTSHAPQPDDRERFPWSSRFAISEALVAFDDVFVPNDRVFLDGQVEHSATWAHALGAWERLGARAHAVDTADLLVGLAQLVAQASGTHRTPHVRRVIGDMVVYATMLRAGLDAAVDHADLTAEGHATPNELYTKATKFFAAAQFSRMVRDLHEIAGRELATAPTVSDLEGAGVEIGQGGRDRIRLLNAVRDLTADAYGGWRAVTLLLGGGGLHAQRMVANKHYDLEHARSLARDAAGLVATQEPPRRPPQRGTTRAGAPE